MKNRLSLSFAIPFFIVFLLLFKSLAFAEEVHVYTYNILSDSYIELSSYEEIHPKVLEWNTRKWHIVERINSLNPDVLCLQEVSRECFEFLKTKLKEKGLRGVFAVDAGKHQNGVATFYQKNKLNTVKVNSLLCKGSALDRTKSTRAAIIASFILSDGTKLNIINTKMKWVSFDTPVDLHPAWRQTNFLLDEIIAEKPNEAWILTGDFNFKPNHPTYALLKNNGFDEPFNTDQAPTYYGNGEIKKIDYIFHTRDLLVEPVQIPKIEVVAPIPSIEEPSDHLPIGMKIIPH